MNNLLISYVDRLTSERLAISGKITIAARNDSIFSTGPAKTACLAELIIKELDQAAIIIAEPTLQFASFLLRRSPETVTAITPRDSESVCSLHDIPLVRTSPDMQTDQLTGLISKALSNRKGCIVEGLGIVAAGSMTTEQAYINYSSLFHATYIKYLEELLQLGFVFPEEKLIMREFRDSWLRPLETNNLAFNDILTSSETDIYQEMARTGRYTVEMGLVDSFFGNISYVSESAIFISQTASRLDRLEHAIDRIPFDGSSTAGITASSELPAHRAIAAATGCNTILHGHPKFPVVMSFFAKPSGVTGIELITGIPVVGGEGGQGGLAETLPEGFRHTDASAVIAKGHGVFCIGLQNFRVPFQALVDVELKCRDRFFEMLGPF